ncbi:hypothetical protein [Helicobacter mehlei]|uniref:hypothetical protein n=1 Tax=Helicobacter mehlei TaxID=2316080 RepID=UPI000EB444BA|nr:hypothetical protein [Helicobacter mehlei]
MRNIKLVFGSSISALLLFSGALLAENSGFYGSIGFQYSNMTRAAGSNAVPSPSPLNATLLGGAATGSSITPPNLSNLASGATGATGSLPTPAPKNP